MSLRGAIAGVCAAALWISSAWAQTLTREEEGRAAVGRCYQVCLGTTSSAPRLFAQLAAPPAGGVVLDDEDPPPAFIVFDQSAICEAAIAQVRDMDGCYAGCVDIELAYGVRTSSARDRFLHVFRAERDALRAAGLWTDYRTPPPAGDDFDAACNAYLDSDPEGEAPLLRARRALRPR